MRPRLLCAAALWKARLWRLNSRCGIGRNRHSLLGAENTLLDEALLQLGIQV